MIAANTTIAHISIRMRRNQITQSIPVHGARAGNFLFFCRSGPLHEKRNVKQFARQSRRVT
ncbi:hypothetical protein [Novosphingobium sp. TCA1]|uniref:hypothetical protein n=1 Tax=Novosphingobium sp. TCA1 TaxID=2682474 RepID=UPI0019159F90|nr:hypothetical protein [Novosphingobium sp. TCA1]